MVAESNRSAAKFGVWIVPPRSTIRASQQLSLDTYVLYLFSMRRFGMTDLRQRALAAVDEAADQSNEGPVRRTLALRFTLAFLANFAGERWPFDNFWQAIGSKNDRARWQNANAARNAIRRAVGVDQRGDEEAGATGAE
jgi:hypothetical protein